MWWVIAIARFRARKMWLVVSMALLLLPSRVFAAPVARVDASATHVQLGPYIDVLEDTTGQLSYADVRAPEVAARFQQLKRGFGPNYGLTRSAIWARFTVENVSDVALERWIDVSYPQLHDVEFFGSSSKAGVVDQAA